jgi:CPA2 family monovalent cation:H+ antiporter-2
MQIPLLNDVLILFGLAIFVFLIWHKLRMPVIVGFLITGILAGPHGLALIQAVHEVEILAEIGVVLLLFTIGIEFSFKRLLKIKKSVLLGGTLQVSLTLLITYFIARQFGFPFGESVFLGFLISLSSTAIVLKLIQERAEVDSPYGRTSLAILVYQDVIIVPMMLFTPLLAGGAGNWSESLLLLVGKGIGIILLIIVSARWIVPRVLHLIVRTQSRELFLISIFVICMAVVWLTYRLGLSLALRAFLAGLIVSESEYSHQALGTVLPFKDIFTSFFFISIGMLLDVGFLFQQPGLVAIIALSVLALKTMIAGTATALLGLPFRVAILAGLALSQVGEFSFILSKTGIEHGLLTGNTYQLFLAVSVLTMAATPFIIGLAPRVVELFMLMPIPKKLKSGLYPENARDRAAKKDHLIIVGFGVNGRNVARAARAAAIPYVIIEMNPDTVKQERERGEPIFYGDATYESVLGHAGIKEARLVVVAISDPAATRRITETARRLSPKVHLVIRTRYLKEMKPLLELGADEVIPEEFETSIEIFARVLTKYLVPRNEIEKLIAEARAGGYEMLRSISNKSTSLSELGLQLSDVEIASLRVGERSPLVGKSLAQIGLRRKYEVSVLAIRRDTQILSNPDGDAQLYADDVLFILGQPKKIAEVASLI